MEYVTASQQYAYEKKVMEDYHVPAMVLMEAAARTVARQVEKSIRADDRVLIAAGSGNNGGDAIAVGRILHNRGYQVAIVLVGSRDRASEQNRQQEAMARSYGCKLSDDVKGVDFSDCQLIVDGLFGIGLSRPIEGQPLEVVKKINASPARVYAIDVPSGISAETGQRLGECVRADETVTFGKAKNGMQKEELSEYFGQITVDDIGFFF